MSFNFVASIAICDFGVIFEPPNIKSVTVPTVSDLFVMR